MVGTHKPRVPSDGPWAPRGTGCTLPEQASRLYANFQNRQQFP